MRRIVRQLGLATLTSLALGLFGSNAHADITFTVFTNPHPTLGGGTIGFAYAGNKFVGSVQGDGTNVLYSTDLDGGNVAHFAPTVSIPGGNPSSEHFIASSLGLGGFPDRDLYVAAGSNIMHIDNAGTTGSLFLSSNLASPVRGILFDAVGTFDHDMLVTAYGGEVYRITSAGVVSLIIDLNEDTEGLDIAPIGAGFGSFDGQLIVASEGSGRIRAITPGGDATVLTTVPFGPEELTFVPLNLGASGSPVEGFYGANYTPNVIKAAASEFAGFQGDVIVTSEYGDHRVTRIHWDGTSFVQTVVGHFPNQPEDGIFVTAAIINPHCGPDGTACEDGSACTQGDTCQNDSCVGGTPVTCTASDDCHLAGTCDPSNGQCSNPAAPDSTPCPNGVCMGGVCVPTNQPPDCGGAAASLPCLWPPDHKFDRVSVVGVTDPDNEPVSITITGITQDEPLRAHGSGNTCPDASGVGTSEARLRAERRGHGDGRVYHVSFTAADGHGASCSGTVAVCVPHDQGRSNIGELGDLHLSPLGGNSSSCACVDQGALYDSTGPCSN